MVAAGKGDMTVDLTVRDAMNHIIWSKSAIDHGKFNFETPDHAASSEYDDYYSDSETWGTHKYEFCLVSKSPSGQPDPQIRRRVSLKILSGERAKDYSELAKEEHLSSLEVILRQMGDELQSLLRELEIVKDREANLRRVNEATHSKVVRYSVLSCLFMFCVGGYQMYYLRTYFKKKKLV